MAKAFVVIPLELEQMDEQSLMVVLGALNVQGCPGFKLGSQVGFVTDERYDELKKWLDEVLA